MTPRRKAWLLVAVLGVAGVVGLRRGCRELPQVSQLPISTSRFPGTIQVSVASTGRETPWVFEVRDGTLALGDDMILPGPIDMDSTQFLCDRSGRTAKIVEQGTVLRVVDGTEEITFSTEEYGFLPQFKPPVRFSPSGRLLACGLQDVTQLIPQGVVVFDIPRRRQSLVTGTLGSERYLVDLCWSPDERRIAVLQARYSASSQSLVDTLWNVSGHPVPCLTFDLRVVTREGMLDFKHELVGPVRLGHGRVTWSTQ